MTHWVRKIIIWMLDGPKGSGEALARFGKTLTKIDLLDGEGPHTMRNTRTTHTGPR